MSHGVRNLLDRVTTHNLTNAMQRDREALKSRRFSWDEITKKYTDEFKVEITIGNCRGIARDFGIEINPRRAIKTGSKRGSHKVLVALCRAVSEVCCKLGENAVPGLIEIRQYLDNAVRSSYQDRDNQCQ